MVLTSKGAECDRLLTVVHFSFSLQSNQKNILYKYTLEILRLFSPSYWILQITGDKMHLWDDSAFLCCLMTMAKTAPFINPSEEL